MGDCQDTYSIKRSKSGAVFIGQYENGRLEGKGKFIDRDGDQCEGKWKAGRMTGVVYCRYKTGSVMVNEYENGRRHGVGVKFSPDGSVSQQGTWSKGRFVKSHALKGKRWASSSYREWVLDSFETGCLYGDCDDDWGVWLGPDGKLLAGNWTNGLFNQMDQKVSEPMVTRSGNKALKKEMKSQSSTAKPGKESKKCLSGDCIDGNGVMQFPKGILYEGEFKDGLMNGKGKLTFEENIWEGSWVQGKQEGYGYRMFESGTFYRGEFINGEYQGQGVHINERGQKYTGEFRKGKKHGKGQFYYADGTLAREGYWVDGEFVGSQPPR